MNIPYPYHNNQSFKGKVAVVNELSTIPCKHIKRVAPELKELVKDKSFDLFIKENHKENNIDFIATKPYHFFEQKKPRAQYSISKNIYNQSENEIDTAIITTAENTIKSYETMITSESKTNKLPKIITKFFRK